MKIYYIYSGDKSVDINNRFMLVILVKIKANMLIVIKIIMFICLGISNKGTKEKSFFNLLPE